MKAYYSTLKERMLELTRLFSVENSIFQRFVIIYKYITLINKDPITKNILQKIFDNTVNLMGEIGQDLNEDNFLNVKSEIIHTNEFWVYYSNLKIIYNQMKKIKACQVYEKKDFNNLARLFSKPYSKESLRLSFQVINSNIFEELDRKSFLSSEDDNKKTWFNEKRSILYIKGEKINIKRRSADSNDHKILKYIFINNKNNLKDQFFFSEIAEDAFYDEEYRNNKNSWRKYHDACQKLKNKVVDNTKNKITDFFIFNSGKKGSIKINPKYL